MAIRTVHLNPSTARVNSRLLIALILAIVTQLTVAIRPCPPRCRTCENDVAECAGRSLTAPPRDYPEGTKTINLDGNHIRVIAERTFNNLETVEVLKISENKIVALRNDAFSPFPNLITLDIVDNRISKISKKTFKDLTKLRTLSLNRNRIESLEGIFQFVPNLFQLNVANNKITTIGKDDLSALTSVHYVDLRDNIVSSIHAQAFKNLNNLRYLFLNNNPLISTPQFEFGSQVLQLVDLTYCSLKTVPGPFPSSVTDLRLGHNQIMQVEGTDLLNITQLQLLALNDNELHFLADGSLSHMTQLQELWLRKNNLVYIPRSLPDTIRKVHMDSNNIQQIEASIFSSTSHLDYLTVENNQITKILPNTFRDLKFLNTLNFQGNHIQNLEKDTFTDLGNLSTILLSNNPLRRIEEGAFKNLENLTQLFMCHIAEEDFQLDANFLPEMKHLRSLYLINSPGLADDLMTLIHISPTAHTPLMNLTHLDLSYNTLMLISPRIKEVFPNLVSMPLDGNPLRCSNSLRWLKDWMVSSEVSFHSFEEIVCETPLRLKDRLVRSIEDSEWAKDDEVEDGKVNAKESKTENNQDLGSSNQQDAPQTETEPIRAKTEEKEMEKKPKDEKGRRKGKEQNDGKQKKKSKSDKKGKDRSKRNEKKIK